MILTWNKVRCATWTRRDPLIASQLFGGKFFDGATFSLAMLLTASSIRDSGARQPGGESEGGCRVAAADKWSMECKHKGDFPCD
jgi:hypothetical protein